MPPSIKYHTIEELRESKRKNALKSYYKKKESESEFLQKKKLVKEAMKDKEMVLKFHELLTEFNNLK
jgi:type IV secretory pathway ATPase VirB11/archaellum biosynthesis ATPase